MKRINVFLSFIIVMLAFISCKDGDYIWDEEQYEQYVSFKAPIEADTEGSTPIYIRYKPDGVVTYKLPIIISGSTMNEKTRHIHIAEDLDTVAVINEQRFGPNRSEWWYEPLERGKYYDFDEDFVMEAGCSLDSMDIRFTLAGIDMSRKWVVPLTIVDDPSYDYKKHPRKNYAKAILRVIPFNDYSGSYATSTMEVYLRNEQTGEKRGTAMVSNNRTAYVVDDNTVFFYAGLMNENMTIEDREKYKIYVRFLGHGSDNGEDKKLEIWAENPDINFQLKTINPIYTTATIQDVKLPYLEHRYVSLNIEYTFDDITTYKNLDGSTKEKVLYYVNGSMILERNVNTQIPDEDQAIQW